MSWDRAGDMAHNQDRGSKVSEYGNWSQTC